METGQTRSEGATSAGWEGLGDGLYQILAENIWDYAVFTLDTEGRVLTWSPPAQRLLGYSREEVVGEPATRFYTREDVGSGAPGKELRQALETGRVEEDRWYVRKDGSRFWSGEVTLPLFRDDGLYGFAKVMRDRTDAKRLEDAECYADRIVETVREPLLVLDSDLRVRKANRSFYRAFRVSPQDTESRKLYDLGNGQWNIPRLRTLLEEILSQDNAFDDFEVEHDFPGIGRKFVLLNARRLRLEGTDLILLAIEDVTEQRRAEAERQAVETHFTSMVKNVKDHAIFTLDPEGRVTSWNIAAEQVLGYTEAEVLGRHFSFIFRPEDRQRGQPEAELRAARETGRAEDERWHLRKDGERFWALGIVSALHDAEGRLTGFSKVLRDMTVRKDAENMLRASEDRFRALLQASSEVFYQMNPDWTEMRYLSSSGFLGSSETPCRTWLEKYIPPDDRPRVMAAVETAIRTRRVFELEHRVLRADGGFGWTLSRAIPLLDEAGGITEWFGMASDITERKAADEERDRLLREVQVERDRLSALVESIGDEVWFVDPQWRITLANPAALQAFGLAAGGTAEVAELTASLEILRPDGSPRPIAESPLLRALNGEIIVDEEEMIRAPGGGELRYRQVNAAPVKDRTGRTLGAVAVARDINSRKQAEAALERARFLLAEGQKIGHLGSFEYDVATGSTAWSEEEYRIYGLDPGGPSPTYDALLQRCIHPDDAAVLQEIFAKAMASASVYELEHRILRPDGTVRWVYDCAHPYYDAQGRVARYVGVTLDVTERRRAEETRGRLAAIVESAPDPIISQGLDGIIYTWNRGAERVFGYKAEEIIGRHLSVLLPPERVHELAETRKRLLQGKSSEMPDTMRLTRDGRRINVSIRVAPIFDAAARVIGASAILRDISEHKRLEQEIRRANASLERRVEERTEELSRTIAELERFAYTVAHDLRAPLRSIHRYSELLLDGGVALPGPEASGHLRSVVHAAKRMDQLLGDLLAYSRIGLSPTRLERLDLGPLVREAVAALTGQIEERGAEVEVVGIVPPVQGDRVLISQILVNLLSNALKFVPRERRPAIRIGATMKEGAVRVWVHDNGIGIPPGQQDRIFRLFERLHGQETYEGTGVGLAIVARAAERMGGRAGYESELEKGSCFWVELKAPEER